MKSDVFAKSSASLPSPCPSGIMHCRPTDAAFNHCTGSRVRLPSDTHGKDASDLRYVGRFSRVLRFLHSYKRVASFDLIIAKEATIIKSPMTNPSVTG